MHSITVILSLLCQEILVYIDIDFIELNKKVSISRLVKTCLESNPNFLQAAD